MMNYNFEEQLSKNWPKVVLPNDLEERIALKVGQFARRQIIRQALLFVGLNLASVFCLVVAGYYLGQALGLSSFGYYLSLFYSDSLTIIVYWRQFLSVLAESLPTITLLALLLSVVVWVWSISKTLSKTKFILSTAK